MYEKIRSTLFGGAAVTSCETYSGYVLYQAQILNNCGTTYHPFFESI